MGIGSFFGKLFGVIKGFATRAFNIAKDSGLTDALVAAAAGLVREAAATIDTNEEKRAFVLVGLKAAFPKIPESILNLAIELAVQAFKAAQRKSEPAPAPAE